MSLMAGGAFTLEIESSIPAAVSPPVGIYNFNTSTTVTFSVLSHYDPDPTDGIRHEVNAFAFPEPDVPLQLVDFTLTFDQSSTYTWEWVEQFEVTADVGAGTVVGLGDGWFYSEAPVVLSVTPPANQVFTTWEGDIDGLDSTASTLIFSADRPRNLRAVFRPEEDDPVLTITTALIGTASELPRTLPSLGTHRFQAGTTISAQVLQEIFDTGPFHDPKYWVQIGWEATGSMTNGVGTNTGPFVITEDTTIDWTWERAERVEVVTNATGGSVRVDGNAYFSEVGGQYYYSNSRPLILTAQGDMGYGIDYWEDRFGLRLFREQTLTLRYQDPWVFPIRLEAAFKEVTEVPMVIEFTVPGVAPTTNIVRVGDVFPVTAAQPPAPVPGGGWYEFEGWSGTGDIPASGTSSTLGPFTITRASSLKWHWRQINLAVDGDMDVQIQDVRNGMLTWPSGAGFQYRIEAAEEVFGPYNTLAENLAATPPENTYQLLGHPKSGAHFFRVVRTPQ